MYLRVGIFLFRLKIYALQINLYYGDIERALVFFNSANSASDLVITLLKCRFKENLRLV
jgi:hypothetical protein